MRLSRAVMAFAALLSIAAVQAADKPCTPADTKKAEKSIDNVVTWPQMLKAFQDYSHCDAGAVGELYTETLMRLMVDWKSMDALAGAMQKDEAFRSFVIAHVKSPAAKDDRQSIRMRAKMSCPKGCEALCADLVEATNLTPPAPASAAAPAPAPAAPAATPAATAPK